MDVPFRFLLQLILMVSLAEFDLGKSFPHQLNRQKYLRIETEDTVLLVMLG
jgi:hypothetical protein